MADELKPCPFCRGDAGPITDATRILGTWNLVHRCPVIGPFKIERHTRDGVVETWNRRTPDLIPRADAELAVAEAIRRAAAHIVSEGDRLAEGMQQADPALEFLKELAAEIVSLAPAEALAEVQRMREERDQAIRGRNEWRDDFKALAAAVVGDTGLSAMTVAAQARTFRPRAEQAEAERDTALARVEKLRHQMTEASDPDFIWGAMDNVHDAETTLDDYAAAVSRAIRAALDEETK